MFSLNSMLLSPLFISMISKYFNFASCQTSMPISLYSTNFVPSLFFCILLIYWQSHLFVFNYYFLEYPCHYFSCFYYSHHIISIGFYLLPQQYPFYHKGTRGLQFLSYIYSQNIFVGYIRPRFSCMLFHRLFAEILDFNFFFPPSP